MRHPIMGDPDYWFQDGGRLVPFSTVSESTSYSAVPRLVGRGIFLWSIGISFDHPVTGERMALSIPEPESYSQLREDLKTT